MAPPRFCYFLLACLSLACRGGSDAEVDWGPDGLVDARPPLGDAFSCSGRMLHHVSCNPVTQAGCEVGQKCSILLECETPLLQRTACVPEGMALPGEACMPGPEGVEGFDDCIAGFLCLQDVCTRICDIGPPDGCREEFEPFGVGEYCTTFDGVFYDNIGLCMGACDPANDQLLDGQVVNSDCAPDEACVSDPTRGTAVCLQAQ